MTYQLLVRRPTKVTSSWRPPHPVVKYTNFGTILEIKAVSKFTKFGHNSIRYRKLDHTAAIETSGFYGSNKYQWLLRSSWSMDWRKVTLESSTVENSNYWYLRFQRQDIIIQTFFFVSSNMEWIVYSLPDLSWTIYQFIFDSALEDIRWTFSCLFKCPYFVMQCLNCSICLLISHHVCRTIRK